MSAANADARPAKALRKELVVDAAKKRRFREDGIPKPRRFPGRRNLWQPARYLRAGQTIKETSKCRHLAAITMQSALRGSSVPMCYDTSGNKIGEVEDLILEKTADNILFAVIGFGGLMGMGEKYHPVPWAKLDYDPDRGGYVVPFSRKQLGIRAGRFHSRTDPRRRQGRPQRQLFALRRRFLIRCQVFCRRGAAPAFSCRRKLRIVAGNCKGAGKLTPATGVP